MNNIIAFLQRYATWIVFLIYMGICGSLLVHNNPFQQYLFLSSANGVASTVYSGVNGVTSYFNLRGINEDLLRRNSELEFQILGLKKEIAGYRDAMLKDSLLADTSAVTSDYAFIIAHVINNSISRSSNYITIDKGRLDGITKEMGVVDHNGVVGAVDLVSDHASRVISVLNRNFNVSVKVKRSNHIGRLEWDGDDYREALLYDLPKHAVFHKGDTVVTSGFSDFFPPEVPVGVILSEEKGKKEFLLRVRLFTDFSTLGTVRVIGNRLKEEIRQVEETEALSE